MSGEYVIHDILNLFSEYNTFGDNILHTFSEYNDANHQSIRREYQEKTTYILNNFEHNIHPDYYNFIDYQEDFGLNNTISNLGKDYINYLFSLKDERLLELYYCYAIMQISKDHLKMIHEAFPYFDINKNIAFELEYDNNVISNVIELILVNIPFVYDGIYNDYINDFSDRINELIKYIIIDLGEYNVNKIMDNQSITIFQYLCIKYDYFNVMHNLIFNCIKIMLNNYEFNFSEENINNQYNEYNFTPLMIACIEKNNNVINILLEKGARADLFDNGEFFTPNYKRDALDYARRFELSNDIRKKLFNRKIDNILTYTINTPEFIEYKNLADSYMVNNSRCANTTGSVIDIQIDTLSYNDLIYIPFNSNTSNNYDSAYCFTFDEIALLIKKDIRIFNIIKNSSFSNLEFAYILVRMQENGYDRLE